MKLLVRSSKNCALLFAWFEGLCLLGFVSVPITIFVFPWFDTIQLLSTILFILVSGLVAYQIEYRPIFAVMWCLVLVVPFVNLVAMVVLFIQAKSYLKRHSYKFGLWGAFPINLVPD
jgi:hypothetical protein